MQIENVLKIHGMLIIQKLSIDKILVFKTFILIKILEDVKNVIINKMQVIIRSF
jgi:hypothetical protein